MPGTFEDVIELLIPELQRRGIFWNGYAVDGGTYRENLYEEPGQKEPFDDHPAAKLIWRAPSKQQKAELLSGANGYSNGTGVTNGWHEEAAASDGEKIDPMSMQLG